MKPDEIFIQFLSWVIKGFKWFVCICFLAAIFYMALSAPNIMAWLDSLNISYYVKKYELIPFISSVVTAVVAFVSLFFVHELAKKREFYKELALEEVGFFKKKYSLLKTLFLNLDLMRYKNAVHKIHPETYIEELEDLCNDIFQCYENYFEFPKKWEMDKYIDDYFFFLYLKQGVANYRRKVKSGDAKIFYTEDGLVRFDDFFDELTYYLNKDSIKILKKISSELRNLEKTFLKSYK